MASLSSDNKVTEPIDKSEENSNEPPKRAPLWLMLTVCAAVTLTSLLDSTSGYERDYRDRTAIGMFSTTMCVGFIVTIIYKSAPDVTSNVALTLEGVCIVTALVCTGFGLQLNVHKNFFGLDEDGNVVMGVNANTYYFSWGTFVATFLLISSYLKSTNISIDDSIIHPSKRISKWFALCVFGLIVMLSSVQIYHEGSCSPGNRFCDRTIFAITLGAFSSMLSGATLFFKFTNRMPERLPAIEALASTVIATSFCVGVGYVTGSNSPGSYIGNLYYFTWLSFLLSIVLSYHCVNDVLGTLVRERLAKKGVIIAGNDLSKPIFDKPEDNV